MNPAWVNARWLKQYGPADLCPPGFDRSVNDALVEKYLRTATANRAWFLSTVGSGLVQRWHAKCVAESDFGVVRDKRSRGQSQYMCECGAAVESMAHIYLDCPLYCNFRDPLSLYTEEWIRGIEALPSYHQPAPPIRTLEDALHWVHHNTPLVDGPPGQEEANQKMRQAALAFHSKVLHERYITGKSSRAPHNEAEFLVVSDEQHTHTLSTTSNTH